MTWMTDYTEEETEEELSDCVNGLFLDLEYLAWSRNLKAFSPATWHPLLASLEDCGAPTDVFQAFGRHIAEHLMFHCIESPDYAESRLLMVHFTVSGSMWQHVVWHCPERT